MRMRDYVTGRVLAWLVIALLGSLLGMSRAHAQPPPYNNTGTREQAWQACQSFAAYQSTAQPNQVAQHAFSCVIDDGPKKYRCHNTAVLCVGQAEFYWVDECPPGGGTWNNETHSCKPPCSQREQERSASVVAGLAYTVCRDGCEWSSGAGMDPTDNRFHIETPTGHSCQADDYDCPMGMEKGTGGSGSGSSLICVKKPDDCPAGQTRVNGVCKSKPDECPTGKHLDSSGSCVEDSDQCPAGKTKAPDGSCVDDEKNNCPAGQTKGADGTCKPDADDDDEPDEDNGEFGDSTNCEQPPMCSGDKIACGQVLISWRIECNTRKVNQISGGGACEQPPICAGKGCDALQYAQLLQQWRATCALEKLAGKSGDNTGGNGDANNNGIPDAAENPNAESNGTAPGTEENDASSLMQSLNTSGFLGGGACPEIPSITIAGATLDFGPIVCQQGAAIRALLIAFAMFFAATILAAKAAEV